MLSGEPKKLAYSTFGAACTEVEINLLTGERRVLRSDVLHDAGHSISPAVDMGQVGEDLCMLSLRTHVNELAPDGGVQSLGCETLSQAAIAAWTMQ